MHNDVQFIGVCTEFVGGYYFGAMITGIQQATANTGVSLLVLQERLARMHMPFPGSEHVIGWIVLHPGEGDGANLHTLSDSAPVVVAPVPHPAVSGALVQVDNRGGMCAATLHLIDHGHQRIAYVHHGDESWSTERYAGYCDALAERGIALDPALVFDSTVLGDDIGVQEHKNRGHDAARRLIAAGMPCSALVAATDNCAIAVMEDVQAAGYRIPEDLALVGFDDISEAQYTNPPLSTMRTQFDHIGRAAAELLLRKIAGDEQETVVSVATSLLARRSCGCQSLDQVMAEALASVYDTDRWEAQLVEQLLRIVRYPLPITSEDTAARIWPGAMVLVQTLDGVLNGAPLPTSEICAAAWTQALAQTENIDLLFMTLVLIENCGEQRLATISGANRAPLVSFLHRIRLELMRVRLAAEVKARQYLGHETLSNYQVSIELFSGSGEQAQLLGWFSHTSVVWASLGLWEDAESQRLHIVGLYQQGTAVATPQGKTIPATMFPVIDQFAESAQMHAHSFILCPVRTAKKDWGLLAICGWTDQFSNADTDALITLGILLGASLDRHQALLSLNQQQATLQVAYERERLLTQTILDIGCPLIPILPGALLVPLVGVIDSQRAQQVLTTVLHGIEIYHADSIILDLTGVPIVDTQVAGYLINMAKAATMLGSQVMVVGIRPEIAQSIVGLGLDLMYMHVFSTLASAITTLQKRIRRN